MKILPQPIVFEWDRDNIDKTYVKHGVTNKEAEQVFLNKGHIIVKDEAPSTNEGRYAIFGKTDVNRKLSIIFTARKDKIRVITARDMSRKEKRVYEEKTKVNSQI